MARKHNKPQIHKQQLQRNSHRDRSEKSVQFSVCVCVLYAVCGYYIHAKNEKNISKCEWEEKKSNSKKTILEVERDKAKERAVKGDRKTGATANEGWRHGNSGRRRL